MKACRKSDGKIIEVEAAVYSMNNREPYHKCLSDGHHYPASELDFHVDATETVMQGWVARNPDGDLNFYVDKPKRNVVMYQWDGKDVDMCLVDEMFPDLTWDDDPLPVELTIKRKNNG